MNFYVKVELDEVKAGLNVSDNKAKNCMIDASKIADELHEEQQMSTALENEKKLLEAKAKDLEGKLEEAESSALKNGRKTINKYEDKIRELVRQIDDEERRKADALKNLKKAERGIKEYLYRASEDQKNSERIKVYSMSIVTMLKNKIPGSD